MASDHTNRIDQRTGKFKLLAQTFVKSAFLDSHVQEYSRTGAVDAPATVCAKVWIEHPQARALDLKVQHLPVEVQSEIKRLTAQGEPKNAA